MILSNLYFLTLFFAVYQNRITKTPLFHKSFAFEDFRSKSKLSDIASFQVYRDISQLNCALRCRNDYECVSFLYCDHRFCLINSIRKPKTETTFAENIHCSYHGVKAEEPTCVGEAEWSDWYHSVIIDTRDEWKKLNVRHCYLGPYRGWSPKISLDVEVLEWVTFVHEEKTWLEATNYCTTLGGHLFHSLNGTLSQLDFFYQRFDMRRYWLGIWTEDHVEWRNMNGEIVSESLIIWSTRQPNNYMGIEQYLGADIKVHDFPLSEPNQPLCEFSASSL